MFQNEKYHCVKSVHIRSFSGPYFPTFGLNTERYYASLRIQSECGKIRTRIIPNMDTFYAVYCVGFLNELQSLFQTSRATFIESISNCPSDSFAISFMIK